MAIIRGAIIEAIHEGTTTANRKYEKWTNGSWVTDSGVEGLMVSCIAEAVSRRQGQYESLAMEVPFGDIREMSEARVKRGPRPATLKGRNRADMVLFNRVDRPICVVEVKRTWNAGRCWKDLERIRDLVLACAHGKGGSLRRGFLAMIIAKKRTTTKSADDRIEEYIRGIKGLVDVQFENGGLNVRYLQGDARALGKRFRQLYGDWSAASFCVEISSGN